MQDNQNVKKIATEALSHEVAPRKFCDYLVSRRLIGENNLTLFSQSQFSKGKPLHYVKRRKDSHNVVIGLYSQTL